MTKSQATLVAWTAILIALAAYVFMPLGVHHSVPPHVEPLPPLGLPTSFIAIILALFISRKSDWPSVHRTAAAALILAIPCSVMHILDWQWDSSADPIIGLTFLVAILAVGGFRCHQRAIAIGAFAAYAFAIGSALLPGNARKEIEKDGIRATLTRRTESIDPNLEEYMLELKTLDDSPIGRNYDLSKIRVSSSTGAVLPAYTQRPFFVDLDLVQDWIGSYNPAFAQAYMMNRISSWATNSNIRITLIRLKSPTVALRIPLDPIPSSALAAQANGYSLECFSARSKKTTSMLPPTPCIKVVIRVSGPDVSGFDMRSYEAIDDQGERLDMLFNGTFSTLGSSAESAEIIGMSQGAKWITIEYHSDQKVNESEIEFLFERMAK